MKVTVSIPDELWQEAHPDDSKGPSDTVQRALRVLADRHRSEQRPLAHAPDQENLELYRPMFDTAVARTAASITDTLDSGYQLGLILAPWLETVDFEVLDQGNAREQIQALLESPGNGASDFSYDFDVIVAEILYPYLGEVVDDFIASPVSDREEADLLKGLIGTPYDERPGVKWPKRYDGLDWLRVSGTFADGVLAAFKDVRDEAIRQIDSGSASSGELD